MPPVPFDELEPVLNPSRQADLHEILCRTPARCRVDVALAFVELSKPAWIAAAGLDETNVHRWLGGLYRMPLGAGLRLAKVLGADAETLLEHYV